MDFLERNVWISINIPLKFVHRGPINNKPTLVQVMAWRHVFIVPSVTDISCCVWAIQEGSRVLIYDLNNNINVPMENVISLVIIV